MRLPRYLDARVVRGLRLGQATLEVTARFLRSGAAGIHGARHLTLLELDRRPCRMDLLFHAAAGSLEGVGDGVRHALRDIARGVAGPARAAPDVVARLLARARCEQQRYTGADDHTEQQVANAATVLLDDDVRLIVGVVIPHVRS